MQASVPIIHTVSDNRFRVKPVSFLLNLYLFIQFMRGLTAKLIRAISLINIYLIDLYLHDYQ